MAVSVSPATSFDIKEGDILVERYQIERLIGKGSFGNVYLGKDKWHNDRPVAIKIERASSSKNLMFSQLCLENMVLTQLKGGGKLNELSTKRGGFPKVHHFGIHNETKQRFLVMDLLGPSLQTLLKICEYKFTAKSVLILMDQLLYRIQVLHENGYIHRDLKPANIVMGATGKLKDIVHLIDFGLSKVYWTPMTKDHVTEKSCRFDAKRVGTPLYMSYRGENEQPVSRRDDLETLAYIGAHFLRGTLPWSSVSGSTSKQVLEKTIEMKMSVTPARIFEGCPYAFSEFLHKVKQLKFDEEPQYSLYRRMFRELGKLMEIRYWQGGQFDWVLVDSEEEKRKKKLRNCRKKLVSIHKFEV